MGQISILSLSHKVSASCTTSEMSLSKVAIRRNNSGLTSISIKMSLNLALCACVNSENENLKAILRMAKYSKKELDSGLELKPNNKLVEHSGKIRFLGNKLSLITCTPVQIQRLLPILNKKRGRGEFYDCADLFL